MRSSRFALACLSLSLALAVRADPGARTDEVTMPSPASNPLLAPWSGPAQYGGTPPFDRVKVEQFVPALEAAMAEKLAEVERIAADPAPPTFENTLAALERAGRTLERVNRIFETWSSALSTPGLPGRRARDGAPARGPAEPDRPERAALRAHRRGLRGARAGPALTPEQQRLAWL